MQHMGYSARRLFAFAGRAAGVMEAHFRSAVTALPAMIRRALAARPAGGTTTVTVLLTGAGGLANLGRVPAADWGHSPGAPAEIPNPREASRTVLEHCSHTDE
jgi:hypothetical protein